MGHKKTDPILRQRLRAWLKYERNERLDTHPDDGDFATELGISAPHLSNIIHDKATIGLDVLYKMRAKLHCNVNKMLDHNPPAMSEAGADAETTGPPPTQRRRAGGGG